MNNRSTTSDPISLCGILPVSKAIRSTSFDLVRILRRKTNIQKIGHAGTLDPFAQGVMVMLIGRQYTSLSDQFLGADKQYRATVCLGKTTDTYDIEGKILSTSEIIPSQTDLEQALQAFQGTCLQTPPMFSAKKIAGQKLYDLARKGKTVERQPVQIHLQTTLLSYSYPWIELDVTCSKGTYIRSLAHDLGTALHCGAFLSALTRTRSGNISISDCIPQEKIMDHSFDIIPFLRRSL